MGRASYARHGSCRCPLQTRTRAAAFARSCRVPMTRLASRLALASALLVSAASALQPHTGHQGHGTTTTPQGGGWPRASSAANSRSRTRVVRQSRQVCWPLPAG